MHKGVESSSGGSLSWVLKVRRMKNEIYCLTVKQGAGGHAISHQSFKDTKSRNGSLLLFTIAYIGGLRHF